VTEHLKNNPDFLQQIKHIAINLSGITLSSNKSAQHIIQLIEQTQVPFNKLCFELTETSALSNLDKAINFIEQLRNKGCKFSLDDFGTGMSSFDYLYKLPVNYLKIDGSFITDITDDPVKKEMVIAMQKIAELMHLETIAEFVENQEIIDELDKIGINHHQGYHYSAPRPFESFLK
jgi:EAL domain-containing protein (putative c-di-GMP-specific phosphodiesterase class I)